MKMLFYYAYLTKINYVRVSRTNAMQKTCKKGFCNQILIICLALAYKRSIPPYWSIKLICSLVLQEEETMTKQAITKSIFVP